MSDPGPWAPPNAAVDPPGPDRLLIQGWFGGQTTAVAIDDNTLELERWRRGFFMGKQRHEYELGAIQAFAVREERELFRLVVAISFAILAIFALAAGAFQQALFASVPGLVAFASWLLRPMILLGLRVANAEQVFVVRWSSRAAAHEAARRIAKEASPPAMHVLSFSYLGEQLKVLRASEETLRAWYQAHAGPGMSDAAEDRVVRLWKRWAIWTLGWTLAVPALLVGAFSVRYLLRTPINSSSLFDLTMGATIALYLLMVGGALLQTKLYGLARPWLDE